MSIDEEEEQSAIEWPPDDDDGDGIATGAATAEPDDPVVVLDLLIAALKQARDAASQPQPKYHTVIIPDAGVEAILMTVDTADAFLSVWRGAYAQRVAQIFGFHKGEVILPSAGGDCMVASWGTFPLATRPVDTVANPKGHLGGTPPISKPPPVAESVTADDDEDDLDGVDEELNDDESDD